MKVSSSLRPGSPSRPSLRFSFRGSTARALAQIGLIGLAGLLVAGIPAADAQGQANPPANTGGRNFDARIEANRGVDVAPTAAQRAAVERLGETIPGLQVRFDRTTGAAHAVNNPTGYLTSPKGGTAHDIAMGFIDTNRDLLGIDPDDLLGLEVTDEVPSRPTGATHLYLRQTLDGIPLYNGQLQVHVNRDGRVMSVNGSLLPGLRGAANAHLPARSAADAVAAAARHLGISLGTAPAALAVGTDPQQTTRIDAPGLSAEPIVARLFLLPINRGTARLVWNFQIATNDSLHWYDINVDAVSGKVWTRFDWTSDATYRVYPQPVESPNHTSPTPPSDGRTLLTDPFLSATNASPNGWHNTGTSSFTIMSGNNVHAYDDRDANNAPPASEPSCGTSLACDFAIDLTQAPSAYVPAAVANLFYWTNTVHDVQYQYGFDEVGGNFQVNNFGRGGAGNDNLNAEAQDGSGTCNANFSTPTDGSRPRMQMFTCNQSTPSHDGDLDSGVIVHEYGHGISTRQVGGPANSSCLNNAQEAGEGWSDWFSLVYTAEVGDTGPDKRGIGTYLFGQPATGNGIRALPYSTDPAINNWTYSTISSMPEVHGLGSVWTEIIWRVYWALVNAHGFDPNLFNGAGVAGNQRALLYINEGLKNTACSPTFIDDRDGIIQAATDNFAGEDVCLIWQAFADSGLGTDASTPGSNSTSATDGFQVPAACGGTPPPPPPPPPTCPDGSIDFTTFGLEPYADQDVSNNFTVLDAATLQLRDNTWVRSTQTFTVDANTVVEFQFASSAEGEIHAIGFDENQVLNDSPRHFQFWGTQNWTGVGKAQVTPTQYTGSGNFESFQVRVGDFFTGTAMHLVFTNDNDAGSGNEGRFRCVHVFEDVPPPPPGGCTVDDDFEGGAAGWFNDAASTCTTGAYVLGTPDLVVNGGVTTQVGGDHTLGTGNAIFTAPNTAGAGTDDVDGGNCILGSPTWAVADASTLTVWYFHGQRDPGDDPTGDFFRLEVSTDGGATFSPIVSIGDVTSNAAWTQVSAPIPAGSQVQLRVQASDGPAAGDLVEAGIDDLRICPNP